GKAAVRIGETEVRRPHHVDDRRHIRVDVAVDVDEPGLVELLSLPSALAIEAKVEGVIRREGEEIVRDRVVDRKRDRRSDGNSQNVGDQSLVSRDDLKRGGRTANDLAAAERLEPYQRFSGHRILAALGNE